MKVTAAITIMRPREELERLWKDSEHRPEYLRDAGPDAVRFVDAPGDRGTEIHVQIERGGGIGELFHKVAGAAPKAKLKDDLRRFKQLVEAGEIARSDSVPEGELAERKFKQRPAQPLEESELEKAGVR